MVKWRTIPQLLNRSLKPAARTNQLRGKATQENRRHFCYNNWVLCWLSGGQGLGRGQDFAPFNLQFICCIPCTPVWRIFFLFKSLVSFLFPQLISLKYRKDLSGSLYIDLYSPALFQDVRPLNYRYFNYKSHYNTKILRLRSNFFKIQTVSNSSVSCLK